MSGQDRALPGPLHQALAWLLAGISAGTDTTPPPPDLEAWARDPHHAFHLHAAGAVLTWVRSLDPEMFGDLLTDWLAGTPCATCAGRGYTPDGDGCAPCGATGTVKPPWVVYLGYVVAAGAGEIRLAVHRTAVGYPPVGVPVVAMAERARPITFASGPCAQCGTDHQGHPDGSFAADLLCLWSQAQAHGWLDLMARLEELDQNRPNLGLLEAVVALGRIGETLAARRLLTATESEPGHHPPGDGQ